MRPGMGDIFKVAKQLGGGSRGVVGGRCVRDDSGNLSFGSGAGRVAWRQRYERLLSEEFFLGSWGPDC